jgi:hypothetical protein
MTLRTAIGALVEEPMQEQEQKQEAKDLVPARTAR